MLALNAFAAENIKNSLKQISHQHPRIMLNPATVKELKAGLTADKTLKAASERVIEAAERIIQLKPVTYKKEGKRLLTVSRACLKRVNFLAMAYLLTGNKKFADRAEKEMLAAAAFKDWNPSHFLDVAEMTAALAIGYDWLFDTLSPQGKKAIRQAIIEKGLKVSFKANGWWVNCNTNWNQVCHGGLVLGAAAVYDEAPDISAKIIKRAIKNLPYAMKAYIPAGAYPEGAGYWYYATHYTVMLAAALESSFDNDFGISQSPGFLASADFINHVCGPAGRFFNYSDGYPYRELAPAMYWIAKKRKQPDILYHEQKLLKRVISKPIPYQGDAQRFFPYLLIWYQPGTSKAPAATSYISNSVNPVAMFRSSWSRKAAYIALKGGSPSVNHGHIDVGTFVMESDGVRWAVDLGPEPYHRIEAKGIKLWDLSQNSQRWDIFRLSNNGHSVLIVDGNKPDVKGFAPIIGHTANSAKIDMSSLYKGQLAKAEREISLKKRNVKIEDTLKTLGKTLKSDGRW
jgi:hypothetical protein